jgi:predicted small lipoprotein YifL
MKKILIIAIITSVLSGCGVKGPLYLPTEDNNKSNNTNAN